MEKKTWEVGDLVMTVDDEDYFSGTVVAAFTKLDGRSWRYAVQGGADGSVVLVYRAKELTEFALEMTAAHSKSTGAA